MKILSYNRKNIYKFKNMDKGIYSVRYQIIITKGHKIKTTKWSKRTLIVIQKIKKRKISQKDTNKTEHVSMRSCGTRFDGASEQYSKSDIRSLSY